MAIQKGAESTNNTDTPFDLQKIALYVLETRKEEGRLDPAIKEGLTKIISGDARPQVRDLLDLGKMNQEEVSLQVFTNSIANGTLDPSFKERLNDLIGDESPQ